jgi:lambda family phage tail tape measure protein
MSEVVTTLTIDADTTGADQYQQAMDKAGSSSQSFADSQKQSMLAIAGVGAAFLATLATGNQLLDFIVSANKGLADMSNNAKTAGLSMADFQAIKFAGNLDGITDNQLNAGLQRSAALLADAQRNSNALTKTFELNGLSVKNNNGLLITENELLEKSGKLILGLPNMQDRIKFAETVGFGKELVPLLEQAGRNFGGIGDEARRAGVIITDETISKATEFDRQWRQSSVTFAANLKAALMEWLPAVDRLINQALELAKTLPSAAVKHADDALEAGREAVGLPKDGNIVFEMTDAASEGIKQFKEATSLWGMIQGIGKGAANFVRIDVPAMPLGGGASSSDTEYPPLLKPKTDDIKAWNEWAAALTGAQTQTKLLTNSVADGNNRYDSAVISVQRHTAQMVADTAAVGLGAGKLAEFRAEAQLLSAAQAAGLTVTDAMRERIAKLAADARVAADNLASMNIANDVKRGRDTAFLSQADVEIANQLKGKYADVAVALGSVEAESLRVNQAARSIATTLETNLTTGITDAISGAKSFGSAMQDTGKIVVRAIEEMIVKMLILKPLMSGLSSVFGGGGIAQGPMPDGSVVPSALGNMFDGGNVIPFAQGGIIDREMVVPMARMGEAGPEAIVPLRRGADGNLGIAGGGSGSVTVHTGDTHITVQGNADDNAMRQIKIELAQFKAELPERAVAAISLAKKQRRI